MTTKAKVLTDNQLKKLLSKKNFDKYLAAKTGSLTLNLPLANAIAKAIHKWAQRQGVTQYCHWFFPLMSKAAGGKSNLYEKDQFGQPISCFDGKKLLQAEVDASSFPNGGSRETYAARGYLLWDIKSRIFVQDDVLHIPSVFCSYDGLSLDEKLPLLRSCNFLKEQLKEFLSYMGLNVKNVFASVGLEQEYFLIDQSLFEQRKDLALTGRALLGSAPIIQQEVFHHYFCKPNGQMGNFMHELNENLASVGIIAKAQHNEVAPCQFEVVQLHEQANLATDQNALLVDILQKVAEKHGFKVLLHEKPFEYFNGSGKHNNFSISTDLGLNLLNINDVGENIFLTVLIAIICAVDKHYDLLRLSAAGLGNDLRMGGNEAPPPIISLYIGSDLLDYIQAFLNDETYKIKLHTNEKNPEFPFLSKDVCDRNRTSPFAFTGNKFEFRMLGSSQNASLCNTVLQTIIADEFKAINSVLKCSKNVKTDLKQLLKTNFLAHKRIVFNGNGYSAQWLKEASQRGLVWHTSSLDCFDCLLKEESLKLFQENGVLCQEELKIRYNVFVENYYQNLLLEAKTLSAIIAKQVLPTLEEFAINNQFAEALNQKVVEQIIKNHNLLLDENTKLNKNIIKAENMEDLKNKATFAKQKIALNIKKLQQIYAQTEPLLPQNLKPFADLDDIFVLSP